MEASRKPFHDEGRIEQYLEGKVDGGYYCPPRALKEVLEGSDEQFRQRLLVAQGQCKELEPLLEATNKLLSATYNESVKAAEELSKDYRLNPLDGILERAVLITKAQIWACLLYTSPSPRD